MLELRIKRVLLFAFLVCIAVLGSSRTSPGQTGERANTPTEGVMDSDVNIQLHLLVASNAADTTKMPARFEAVAKELRPVLPFSNYRHGASFLGRVKNARPWSVRGVGRNLLVTPGLELSVLPTFYEVSSSSVTVKTDAAGRAVVQMLGFRFGLRIPLQTGSLQAKDGAEMTPHTSYEQVGISSEVTMREGELVVVGTLDTGRPNETLVLVLVASRASQR